MTYYYDPNITHDHDPKECMANSLKHLNIEPGYLTDVSTNILKSIIPRFEEMRGYDLLPNHLKSELVMIEWFKAHEKAYVTFLQHEQSVPPKLAIRFPYMILIGDIGKTGGFPDAPGRSIIPRLYSFIFSNAHQNEYQKALPHTGVKHFSQLPLLQALYLHHKATGRDINDYEISGEEHAYLIDNDIQVTKTPMYRFWTNTHIDCGDQVFECIDDSDSEVLIATAFGLSHHFSQGKASGRLAEVLDTHFKSPEGRLEAYKYIALLELMDKIEAYMHRDDTNLLSYEKALENSSGYVLSQLATNYKTSDDFKIITQAYEEAIAFLEKHPFPTTTH